VVIILVTLLCSGNQQIGSFSKNKFMSTIPVYVFAKWQVKQGNLDMVLALLKQAAQKTREEKGNLFYKLHQSASDANTILLYEGYTDTTAAEAHRSSDHFQGIVVRSIIPLLENREVIVAAALSD
jgi:(4S)-4-hydroxy-5-phosphonooxypentane-2,3-dione isomerase